MTTGTPILSRYNEKTRRVRVYKELKANGVDRPMLENIRRRMSHHDDLRRARAVVQAIMGYPPCR